MGIPAHICRVLACGDGLNREEFGAHLESLGGEVLPWFLLDQAAREALVASLFDGRSIEVSAMELAESVEDFDYLEIGGLQGDLRFLLKVPAGDFPNAELPTGALVSLARAWPKAPELVGESDITQLADPYKNKLIMFSVADAIDWDKENFTHMAAALLGCRLPTPGMDPSAPHWAGFGRVELDPVGIASQPALMVGRLLQEVLSEKRIRWRYIALYRVFEAAYLIGLKDSLLANFLSGPKDALSKAQTALESELSTFKKLVDDKNLAASFEMFRAIVDGDENNKFLHAIKRSLKGSKSSGHATGVEYAYKIRCAIVHAGQHDVVFDRYPDAEVGVGKVLRPMEAAIVELLGLRRVH